MNRLLRTALAAGGTALAWLALTSITPARADDDFWEDRFNAMRKIWGTPYVPLGYYWDRVHGLPPRPAPVAPGVIADRPIYGGYGYGGPAYSYGGYGYYGGPTYYSRGFAGYAYRPRVSIGIGIGGGGYGYYPSFGYPSPFPGPYGGFGYGW